jgi:uncharacterized protein
VTLATAANIADDMVSHHQGRESQPVVRRGSACFSEMTDRLTKPKGPATFCYAGPPGQGLWSSHLVPSVTPGACSLGAGWRHGQFLHRASHIDAGPVVGRCVMTVPRELSTAECRHLLSAGVVGRVAVSTPVGPRIVPVNYAIHDDAIVFRTSPYSELSTYGWNTELAFEVDDLDYETHQGSSVVALGRARVVQDPEEIAAIRAAWEPSPWAGGSRNLYVKLVWRELTGRRVGDEWPQRASTPYRRLG